MNLVLITNTQIVVKIFSLVCKKLDLNLSIRNNLDIKEDVEIIVVDEEFINDDFNKLKAHTKKLGAITAEELSFDKSRDFIITRPFLPAKLAEILKDEIEYIKEDSTTHQDIRNSINEEEVITSYVESLADDVAYDIQEDNDESIVTIASLNSGGVLDNLELHKISDILHDDDIQNQVVVEKQDWKDISEIIDDALNEVKEYEFSIDYDASKPEPIRLLLNNYNIDELRPFLQKFDQNVIDRLSNGEDVDVTLCLKVNR